MSFWSHNVELMDEIITENLPEPWHTKIMEGEILLHEVPRDVVDDAFQKGELDFWGSQIDAAKMRIDEEHLQKALSQEDLETSTNSGDV